MVEGVEKFKESKIRNILIRIPNGWAARQCHAPPTDDALSILLPLFASSDLDLGTHQQKTSKSPIMQPTRRASVARWRLGLHRWGRRRPIYAVMVLFLSGKHVLETEGGGNVLPSLGCLSFSKLVAL